MINDRTQTIVCPLASGSKGNAIYVASGNTKILFDAGISAKVLRQRLSEIGVQLEEIQAIVVSHEHSDHIAGLKTLSCRLGIPILANAQTAEAIVEELQECPKCKIFTTGEPFQFGDIEILPFTVRHDAIEPVAFRIHTENHSLAICTDLGFATNTVRHHLKDCDLLIVEANHTPAMVHASSRPLVYKQRVLSKVGHLSNEDCAQLLLDVASPKLKKVFLAHLSTECNTPEVALKTVQETLQKYSITLPITVAHQEKNSELVSFK